ncbi:hypothetical protein BT69DRAFT_1291300 [Atractiella rhizophila]|nr:hypothetical protein BT69DRAFT_1291300 [Atractiella rhizophila]
MSSEKFNANPTVLVTASRSTPLLPSFLLDTAATADEVDECEIDEEEVFDLIRSITDPEHPKTLEQLAVVKKEQVNIRGDRVFVEYTPTTPACGMASIIGLTIIVRLIQSLPNRMKVQMSITPGSYNQAKQVAKQLNDKERVAAAMEVPAIMNEINRCLAGCSGSLV